ncbi:MAG: HlyD family efflux transporter periplasmic adaptor subunit [Phycisphaerae bacterium]|nr:HlyD family efflux transporter periplasmic adaptor subunit [Phycisphaerae bacterium]
MNVTSTEPKTGRPAEDFCRATDLFAKLRTLAAEQTSSGEFVGAAFRVLARECNAVYALLRARVGTRALDDYWHSGPTDPSFWKATVQSALDASIARAAPSAKFYRARLGTGSVVLIAAPMPDASGDVNGAIGLVVECDDEFAAHEFLAQVRSFAAAMPVLASSIARDAAREGQAASAGGASVSAFAAGASAKSRTALSISLTNQLRTKIGCEQVILATVRGRRLKLMSISGFAEVAERSPGVAVALTAMSEALDLGRTVTWSPSDHANDYALHRKWSVAVEGAAVATIPLKNGDRVTVVLGLRQVTGRRFSEEDLKKIGESAQPFAAALDLVHRATRSVPEHAGDSSVRILRAAFRSKNLVRTLCAVSAIVGLSWFVFGTIVDQTTLRCRLTAASSMHLSTPFDATLLEAPHAAGDRVQSGEVIARFDTTELELERSRLLAAIEKARIESDIARARGRESDAMLVDARAGVDRAALQSVDHKIAAAVVRAPTDGVLLAGDLRRVIGSAVPTGQMLYEFAEDGALRLELSIPDRDVTRVLAGADGEFVSVGRPDFHVPIVITRVRPSSELRDGQNVFIAEATFDAPEPWMRNGVEGFARIKTGDAPVWRAYLRRAIDFVRMRLWL